MQTAAHNCSEELKQADLHVTPARIAAMQLFETHDKPVDAQHIIEHLSKELGVDRVTVFRILNTFTEKGLIRKVEFGEGKARYELNTGEHHHLICQECGRIESIEDCHIEMFKKEIKEKTGFIVKSHSLEFFGICKNCQK